ncbi:RNA polymerase sigma-70 factor, ECF subfamily [Sphingomonas sp. OV641]|uniref:FecI sigma-24 factor n=5 Tax=Sphingomonadaceae TaxID=41297 RepID=A0A1E1F7F2_9SPHN|nr:MULTISPECIES: RNA polymerase sigma factor [Sphingomonadaceae]MBZ6382976.1 RNA polymerase sigma factor [Sphingomonas sanguinis]MEA3539954.1 RNA polymerase sigma factor [Pseudomonadota bacterium]HEX2020502.1 RNA polymerase sigma factor [Aurantimonas sp.]KKI21474.1 FecI sigma-24 factor [Sphingomonas sp. Ag1]MDF0491236.1 RNA polymerase sigma factor [Sphingomonas pollutisoli]
MSLDLAACTDGELAALTLGGRQAAFAEIMRRHQKPVYRLIRSHIGDAEEALDLTQECFVAAFQNLRKYDGERPLAAWLTRVAINKSRDWHRRRRIRQILSFASSLPPETMESGRDEAPGADAVTFDRAELARLSRAVSELPATLKETLLLRTVEGLSQGETAAALGISGKAVEMRLRRARERLSKNLDLV